MSEFTTPYVAKALRGPETMDWMDQRACNGVPPEVFFPDVGGSPERAKSICASCPVAAECLHYALENREEYGVWGGTSAKQRRDMQKPPRRPSVAACGTDAGYYRHIRQTRTEPCRPCLEAHAAASAEYREANREAINARKREERAGRSASTSHPDAEVAA